MAVIMKIAVFWDVTPCGCCKNRRFGGMYCLHYQGDKSQRARNNVISNYQPKHTAKEYYVSAPLLLVIADVIPRSPILVTLIMDAI
jgi:hypothetical protein